jgi:soluble lytic murein transglycosylase-like protein
LRIKFKDQEVGMRKVVFILILLFIFKMPAQVNAYCFEYAGQMYGIHPNLLWSIAKVESGFNPSAINFNSNGSYDYGLMQINSSWYKVLGKELWNSLSDPCTNVCVGAWILSQCIQKHGYTWEAVGCYNSSNKNKKVKYANKVYAALVKGRLYAAK